MKNRTILLVGDANNDLLDIKALLEDEFNIAYYFVGVRRFEQVKNEVGSMTAAIISVTEVASNDYDLFEWIASDSMIAGVPLFVYCKNEEEFKLSERAIELGAVDAIVPPITKFHLIHRIENGVDLKNSLTFLGIEKTLKLLPSNIYLKDEKGRYVFATHYWHHLDHSDDPDWTIRGKTDLEIRKDKANARKALQSDLQLIATGKGTRYVIEEKADGVSDFLEIIKEPVKDEEGHVTGIIAIINDVTESIMMRKQIEELSIRDVMTGLRNKRGYELEVERVEADYKENRHPYGVVMIDMNDLKQINDTFGHEQGNEAIIRLANLICDIFMHSPVFRVGGDEFVVILEKNAYDERDVLVTDFLEANDALRNDTSLHEWERVSAALGMAVFDPEKDTSFQDVFNRADSAMYEHKKRIKGQKG